MSVVGSIGAYVLDRMRSICHLTAIAVSSVWLGFCPGSWHRPVQAVFARQIFFTGVQAVWFTIGLAVFAGLGVVAQAQFWMSRLGQSELLGPFLVTVIFRELGPLLVALIVIGRSGSAIATELGGMMVRNEIRVLDAQGIDPMLYLIMPRVLGMALSIFCLTMFFGIVSLVSGYLCGLLLGVSHGYPGFFFSSVLHGIVPADIYNLVFKTVLPGLVIGAICCVEGTRVEFVTEVPQAATRAVIRANTAMFVIIGIISLLTYL